VPYGVFWLSKYVENNNVLKLVIKDGLGRQASRRKGMAKGLCIQSVGFYKRRLKRISTQKTTSPVPDLFKIFGFSVE
jgi:hypothetical protein